MTNPLPNVSKLIQKLRDLTADLRQVEEQELLGDDEMLTRFLKSCNWNIEICERMLRKTVAWRVTNHPQFMECQTCLDYPGTHNLRQVGFDESGRPVIYASFYQFSSPQRMIPQAALTHLIYTIENAVRSMKEGVTQWVFVLDCAGMTLASCSPRLGYECAQLMSQHYPERLGVCICIRPGSVFQAAWRAMKPFLHPVTVSKVVLVTSKSQLTSVLSKYCSDDLCTWFLNEYNFNRKKPVRLRYRAFWDPSGNGSSSSVPDPRGEKRYVDDWITRKHPSGHLPHPNIVDYMTDCLKSANLENGPGSFEEDDMAEEMDEAAAEKMMMSLAEEFQIPKNAHKFE